MIRDQRGSIGRKFKKAVGLKQVGNLFELPKLNTLIVDRLVETAGLLHCSDPEVTFQHSILCQTGLPYRSPAGDVREWSVTQGNASLMVEAGQAFDPETGAWEKLGLPWGPKARLILMHLNAEAVRTRSPEIDVGDSLTAFVKRIGLTTDGRTIRSIKDQVGTLAAATIRMAFASERGAFQVNTQVVSGFDLWFPKDSRQRVLWPSFVVLGTDYFESLASHAVPLEERAIAALSHSAMCLDIYTWLAQRLHRIQRGKRQFLAWPLLKEQFGADFTAMNNFRRKFMVALRQVSAVYGAARIDVTEHGLFLFNSPPPVARTGVVLSLPASG